MKKPAKRAFYKAWKLYGEQYPPLWCEPVPPCGCSPFGQAIADAAITPKIATSSNAANFFITLNPESQWK